MARTFIDKLRILVQAGNGAVGNPKARGKGGDGGAVVFTTSDQAGSLAQVAQAMKKRSLKATHGIQPSNRSGYAFGKDGSDLKFTVPTGVEVYEEYREKESYKLKLIGSLLNKGSEVVVAKGGLGGGPKTNYVPELGEKKFVVINLKLLSDLGLVGFPNAGKSSILKAVTGKNVKIANYPFTTITPTIGTATYPDKREITMTDLPGLADRAADFDNARPTKKHDFLKHLERNHAIITVIDVTGFQMKLGLPFRGPVESALLLARQLEEFSQGVLIDKPNICVLNKIDLVSENETKRLVETFSQNYIKNSKIPDEFKPRNPFKFSRIFPVSVKRGDGVDALKEGIRTYLDELAMERIQDDIEDRKQQMFSAKERIRRGNLDRVY